VQPMTSGFTSLKHHSEVISLNEMEAVIMYLLSRNL
jgi:hypothetical protein